VVADGVLDLGLDLNLWPWIWIGVAVVFAVVELAFVGGTFVLLPFAVSSFISAILGFYDVPVEVQWAVFVLGGGLLFAVAYRWVRRVLQDSHLPVGVGADRLVGMTGFVTATIEPTDFDRRGRVTIEGEVWGALAACNSPIAAGTPVRVTEVVGTRLIVEPIATAPFDEDGAPTGRNNE
jgi:membrane protein implicated in regulation of membrane protease activity